jgi:hypothetical protein
VDGILDASLPKVGQDLAEHVRQFGDMEWHSGSMSENELYNKWNSLTDEQRIAVLEKGEFTGMLADEVPLDFADLYREATREDMINTLQDQLTNVRDGYDVEDTNHYILRFKDSDTIIHSNNLAKPLTKTQLKKLEFISANSGLSNYRYWVAYEAAKARMIREMGFIEYRNGKVVASHNGADFFGNDIHKLSESSLERGLKVARKELIRQDREIMIILNNKGTEIGRLTGDSGNVYLNDNIEKLMRNNHITHNHPTGKGAKGIMRYGFSLSLDDMHEAVYCNVRSITAETAIYRYTATRPSQGWNVSADEIKTQYRNTYNELKKYYVTSLQRDSRYTMLLSHLTMKLLSKQYGFKYEYTKL